MIDLNELDNFAAKIIKKLPPLEPEDLPFVLLAIRECYESKFTLEDTVTYCRCMEEFLPDPSEDIALLQAPSFDLQARLCRLQCGSRSSQCRIICRPLVTLSAAPGLDEPMVEPVFPTAPGD